MKLIKRSSRGLTFSMGQAECGSFLIGTHYSYLVDVKTGKIIIRSIENGGNTVSMKRSGEKIKPLIDIRSAEIRSLVSAAEYLSIEMDDTYIIVRVHRKVRVLRDAVTDFAEAIGLCKSCKETPEIIIPKAALAAGGSLYIAGKNYSEISKMQEMPGAIGEKSFLDVIPGFSYQHAYENDVAGSRGSRGFNGSRGSRGFSGSNDSTGSNGATGSNGSTGNNDSTGSRIKDDLSYVYRVCSLFSGAGMLDYPFHKDPAFKIVFANDSDAGACMTYRRNIGKHILCAPISEVDGTKIHAEVGIGGPCCFGFSNANRTNLESDESQKKRDLIDEYIRVISNIKEMKVIVVENVPQFLSRSQGKYMERLLSELPAYEFSVQNVVDCEVGGYTSRKRAIVIGSKIGQISLPNIKVSPYHTVREALSLVDSSWFNYSDVSTSTPDTARKMSYVRPGHNFKDIPPEAGTFGRHTHSDRYRRLNPDEVAPTIVNWRKICLMPPEGNRVLSVAEAAALQGFKKDFCFLGTIGQRQQQVGNGVPYAIANLIKNTIKQALNAWKSSYYLGNEGGLIYE